MNLKFKVFTGGIFETNCYLVECPEGNLLIDAPEGAAKAFDGAPVSALFLTHGHFDHVVDGAEIKRTHGCEVLYHPETGALVETAEAFKKFGFALEIEPFEATRRVEETANFQLLGTTWQLLHVPGHCPGSLCLFHPESGQLFAGDTLFRESVGRSDLPGGDGALLSRMIHEKLFSLPEATVVHPGHGPSTTIGHEKKYNPFLVG